MAKAIGTHICEYCNYEFKWEKTIRQKATKPGLFEVDVLDNNAVHPQATFEDNDTLLILRCRCPKCDEILRFEHTL